MPGYNHKPDCSCGWCIKEKKETTSIDLSYGFSNSIAKPISTHYSIQCWWCGDLVHYHSNGYGNCVLFDEYAPPWPVHGCYEIHQQRKKAREAISEQFLKEHNRVNSLHDNDQRFIDKVLGSFASRPTEEELASRLRLSILHLRKYYGHCYSVQGISGEDWRKTIYAALNEGADLEIKIKINAQIASNGGTQKITFDIDELDKNFTQVRKTRCLCISIPPGVTSAQRLRVREQGYPSYSGESSGDLYIYLDIIEGNSAE